MFRTALRQSTRAVGALSATSRIAVVSLRTQLNDAMFSPRPPDPAPPQSHRPPHPADLSLPSMH